MDTAQWPQDMGMSKSSIEAIMVPPTCTSTRPQLMERRPRPPREHALNCPRCHSSNTKFCYYNNYSLSQPRYFCKTCRRYWTEGGSLRNVPVGGGSRKNKRPSKRPLDLPHASTPTPSTAQMSRFDLAFQTQMGSHFSSAANPAPLISMTPEQDNAYSGLALQDLRTNSIAFQVGGIEEDGGYNCNFQEGGRVLFPFEDLRRRDADVDQTRAPGADPLFWNSVMGGGGTSW